MANLGNMLSAAAFFSAAARRVSGAEHEGLEKAAKIIEDGAKAAISTYEFGWAPLSPATVARKGADTPLLETGALRDSITHELGERSVIVGTPMLIGRFQEFGTSRGIPPRPFIWGSWTHHQHEVIEAFADAVVTRLGL